MAYVSHTPYYRQSFSNMFYDYLGVCTVVRNMAYVIHVPCILRIFNTEAYNLCETQWRHSVKTRLYNTPILHCISQLGENKGGHGHWVSQNIVSIVQVPDTFFENNNIDEIAVSDDLVKWCFHHLKKQQRMLHKIVFFMPHQAFPITAQSIIEAMSSNIHSEKYNYGTYVAYVWFECMCWWPCNCD